MKARLDYFNAVPAMASLLTQQEATLHEQFEQREQLSVELLELIKLRVSQINQCAFCIDMHSTALVGRGVDAKKLWGLPAWRDLPYYSEAERGALAWAERLTGAEPVSDADYQHALAQWGENDLVLLSFATNAINSWNRIAKCFKTEVGSFSGME